ncbi:MAG: BTAD domain-containing putative transcriptional regulator, partial [Anaerolineales bacterium]
PLTQAARLYRGDFMTGFTLRDSPAFDDWQFFEAERLRRKFAGALERLVACHAKRDELDPAIQHARRWLALDPLHEPAHRVLMRLYAQSGHRAAALRQYRECVRILESELGVPRWRRRPDCTRRFWRIGCWLIGCRLIGYRLIGRDWGGFRRDAA